VLIYVLLCNTAATSLKAKYVLAQDMDGSGELSLDEMMSVLRAMGQNPTQQETLDLMKEASLS